MYSEQKERALRIDVWTDTCIEVCIEPCIDVHIGMSIVCTIDMCT